MTSKSWINPNERLPEQGALVWVLQQHPKERGARSCEIMCGEVSYGRDGSCLVQTFDDTGKGAWGVYLSTKDGWADETGIAWVYAEEIPLPPWAGNR
jgi:hypothetical protein